MQKCFEIIWKKRTLQNKKYVCIHSFDVQTQLLNGAECQVGLKFHQRSYYMYASGND